MDQQELDDWRDLCEGRKPYAPFMLSNMFMSMFAEPLSEKDRDDLRSVFSYIPDSSRTLDKMLRISAPAQARSDKDIKNLVMRDLKEKRRIIDDPEILAAIDSGVTEIVCNATRFRKVFEAPLNVRFVDAMTGYYGQIISERDEKTRVLSNAFYGIACDMHLELALTADLVGADVSFDNYFELYLIGANYALERNGALAFKHVE